jgi:polysaccharide biosynthesis transport protein
MSIQSVPSPDDSPLLRAVDILRRRATLAAIVFVFVFAAAAVFVLSLPDLFRARAAVLVERPVQSAYVQSAPSDELDTRLQVIRQEVLSRARLTDLITRFNLYPDLRAEGHIDTALEQVRRDINVESTGAEQVNGRLRTVVLNVSFTGNSPDTSAQVANALASFYVDHNSLIRSEEAARTASFLKTQVEEARARLEGDDRQIRAYTNRYSGALPQQVDVNLATLERLNTQLRLNVEQQMRLVDQRERLLEPRPGLPVVPPGASPRAARLEALRLELAQYEGYSDKHPDVRRINAEMARLEASEPPGTSTGAGAVAPRAGAQTAPAARARTLQDLDADGGTLRAEEQALRQSIAQLERRLDGVPRRQNEFVAITRGHEANRAQFESLLKRYEEAGLSETLERTNQGERFRIVERAVPPAAPSAPNRLFLLIAGLMLAAVSAGTVILFRERLDGSFHSVEDLQRFTRVPVLVSVPTLDSSGPGAWLRAAGVTAATLAATVLAGTLCAYLALGNEPLVRLLANG